VLTMWNAATVMKVQVYAFQKIVKARDHAA
jgi:hypothetical protein